MTVSEVQNATQIRSGVIQKLKLIEDASSKEEDCGILVQDGGS